MSVGTLQVVPVIKYVSLESNPIYHPSILIVNVGSLKADCTLCSIFNY